MDKKIFKQDYILLWSTVKEAFLSREWYFMSIMETRKHVHMEDNNEGLNSVLQDWRVRIL